MNRLTNDIAKKLNLHSIGVITQDEMIEGIIHLLAKTETGATVQHELEHLAPDVRPKVLLMLRAAVENGFNPVMVGGGYSQSELRTLTERLSQILNTHLEKSEGKSLGTGQN